MSFDVICIQYRLLESSEIHTIILARLISITVFGKFL